MAGKSKNLELKTRIGVDGETTYKQSLNSIASSLRVMKAEMAATQSAFGDNANSIEALTAKQRALQDQQEKHAEKVKLLKEMLELAKQEFGENSAEADDYRIKVANAETALNKCTTELDKTTAALDEMGSTADGAGDDADSLGGELDDLGKEAKDTGDDLDDLGEDAGNTGDDLDGLGESADGAGDDADSLGDKLKDVAGVMGGALKAGAELAAAAFKAVLEAATAVLTKLNEFADDYAAFDDAMLQVQATMGATADEMGGLRDAAMAAGQSTRYSAVDAADALNYLALAGYSSEEAVAALPSVLNLAAAGNMDLASACDMATDAMSALGLTDMDAFLDSMAKTSQRSNTSIEQLGSALLTIGATGRDVAGGVDELNLCLGLLADNGIKGSEGGTKLRNIILSLSTPTDDAAAALKSLGVSVYDANGDMQSLETIMRNLSAAMDGMTSAEKTEMIGRIFNKTDLAAVNALLGTTGERWDELSAEIEAADGTCKEMADTLESGLGGSMRSLDSATSGLKITIGESVAGIKKDVVDGLTQLALDATTALSDGFQPEDVTAIGQSVAEKLKEGIAGLSDLLTEIGPDLGAALGNLVDTAVEQLPDLVDALLPVATSILSGITDGITNNAEKIGALAGDIVAKLGGFLTEHAVDLVNAAGDVLGGLIDGLTKEDNLAKLVTSAVEMIGKLAGALVENAGELLAKGPEIIGQLVKGLKDVDWQQLGLDLINGLINGLTSAVTSLIEIIKSIFTGIWDAIKGVFGINSPSTVAAEAGKFILDGLVEGFSAAVDAVCETVKKIFGKIWDAIKSIFGFGGESEESKESKQAGKDIMTGIKDGITGSENDAKTAAKDAAKKILDTLKTELGVTSGNSTKTKPYGEGVAKGIADGMKGVTESTFSAGVNAIQAAVSNALGSAFGVAGTGFAGMGEQSAKKYEDVGKAICKAIADGINAGSQNTDAVKDAITKVANAAYEAAVGEMAAGITGSEDEVNAAVETVAEAAVKAAEDILTEAAGEEIGDDFTGGIEGGVEDAEYSLLSQVKATGEAVKQAVQAIVNELTGRTAGQALSRGLTAGISSGTSAVRSAASSLATSASMALWNAVGSNGSNFTAIGSAIASGVARGIENGASRITQAARSAAQAAYNAAARTLGIASPSKKMQEIGQHYDEGFAQGIESGMRGVIDSATQLSNMAAASIQTTRSRAEKIDYDKMGTATAKALKQAGIDRPMLAVGKRVLAEAIEPDVSRATRQRSGQSIAGRSSRMVIA